MQKHELTAARARELFRYDPSTGSLTWKVDKGAKRSGDPAGHLDKDGYRVVGADGTQYFAHRVAWLIHHGRWPDGLVDHKDGDHDHNAVKNLREATTQLNGQNLRAARQDNVTGLLGVSPHGKKFAATIKAGGKKIWLGRFSTPTLAHEAYLAAKRQLHAGCTI
jgi:hypothetical protein